MTTLRLENVSKTYRNTKTGAPIQALDQVNLNVREAQTMAIVGPSGSGKSTLLRLVAGRELDYSGDLFFDNRNMRKVKPRDRYLSLIFQDETRYPHFQGRSKLDILLRRNLVPDEETEERIRMVAETMGLNSRALAKRKQGVHRNGQDHRLAIGRAMARDPELFLFDEPFSNFDTQLRTQTRVELKRLLRHFRTTALFVTHDQTEAMAIGTQIAVMNAGRVEQAGTYRQLYERPANTFVAGFLGLPPMNLFTNLAVTETGAQLNQMAVPLPPAVRSQVNNGQTVTVGIRPEEIVLASTAPPLPDGVEMQGQVDFVEPDFARNVQLIHLKNQRDTFIIRTPLSDRVQAGNQLKAIVPFDNLHFFDDSSQERMG